MKYFVGDNIIVEELKESSLNETEDIIIDSSKFPNPLKYYQQNLQGKIIKHKVLGDIHIGAKGRKETYFRSPPNYLAIVCFIDKIIEQGYSNGLPEQLEHSRKNDTIYEFYRIYNVVTYDNKPISVTVFIAQDIKGKKYYLFKADEINENFLSNEKEVISNPNKLQEVSNYNISQNKNNVNTQNIFERLNKELKQYIGE